MPNRKIKEGTIWQANGLSYIVCFDTSFLIQVRFMHHAVYSPTGKPVLLNAVFYTLVSQIGNRPSEIYYFSKRMN